MVKTIINWDFALSVLILLFGCFLGFLVSKYYYQQSLIDIRESLVNAATTDIEGWLQAESYPELYDSVKYAASGTTWSKLSSSGLDDLSKNVSSFINFEHFGDFKNLINACKREGELFNEKMNLRNISIVCQPGVAALSSPRAIHNFQTNVRPSAASLLEFLEKYRSGLLGD